MKKEYDIRGGQRGKYVTRVTIQPSTLIRASSDSTTTQSEPVWTPRPKPVQHCDCHVLAERDLRGAIYWLLRGLADDKAWWSPSSRSGARAWLTAHGYNPNGSKAKRLLARKRVSR